MAIEKYTTEAFILKEYARGEADFVYKVWTRDYGVIFMIAKSIRKVNAKLRMLTKKNNFLALTLVKGKELWRLVGVEELEYRHLEVSYLAKIKSLVNEAVGRFLEEKKPYPKLFRRLKELTFNQETLPKLDLLGLKTLVYYLVLVDTGYADATVIGAKDLAEYKNFKLPDFYLYFALNQRQIKEHLHRVLKESML